MTNTLVKLVKNYREPPEFKALVSNVKGIFRNVDTQMPTSPETIRNLEIQAAEQAASYKKGIVLGAVATALGAGTLIFGPKFAETAGNPNYANYILFGLETATAFGGINHMIRSFSLYLGIKGYFSEGVRYGMLTMKTPDRKM